MAIVAGWSGNGLADGFLIDDGSRGWGDDAWFSVTTNGSPCTVSASGLQGQRIEVNQAAGESAQLIWDTAVMGTLGAHTTRFYTELTAYPSANGRLLSVYNSGLTLQYWIDVTPTGSLRLKDGAGNTLDTSAAALPLNTVLRLELVADGAGNMTVSVYLGNNTGLWDTLTGAGVGTTAQEFRFGNPNAAPTWPTFYLGGIIVTDTAALIGPSVWTSIVYDTAGTFGFTPPAGVSEAYVETWGGGGSGGASGVPAGSGGGGGGGGEYAADRSLDFTPEVSHQVIVGAGDGVGSPGGNSQVDGSAFSVLAKGGSSTNNSTGAAGGTGSANPIHFNGGAGASGNASGLGGGGGSSAGPGGVGGGGGGATSAPNNGGTAPYQGGDGGGGGTTVIPGETGTQPGGGGGGKGNGTNAGNGADGQVVISYLDPTEKTSSIGFRGRRIAVNGEPAETTVLHRPPSVQDGDRMLAMVATTAAGGITAPSGWSILGTELAEGNAHAALYTKVAGAEEPGSYTWDNGGLGASIGVLAAWSGSSAIADFALLSTLDNGTSFDSPSVTVPLGGWLITIPWQRRNAALLPSTWTISDGSDAERGEGASATGTGSDFSAAVYDSDRPLTAGDYHRTVTSSHEWAQVGVWSIALTPTSTDTDFGVRLAGAGEIEAGEATVVTQVTDLELSGAGSLDVTGSPLVTVPAGPVDLPGVGALVIDDSLVTIPAGPVDLAGAGGLVIDDTTVLVKAEVTMGGFGTLVASVRYPETLLVNGIDVYECIQYMTPDVDGLISPPGKKTGDVDVPQRHGAIRTPHKRYAVAQMPLTVWVKGTNPDGSIPSNRREAFYDNLNTILRAFTGDVELEHITPNGESRVISGEVLDKIDFTRYVWGATGKVGVVITAAYPFWRDKDPTTVSIFSEGAHTLTEFAPATAPVEYMTITFEGPSTNPRIACGDYFVQYNGTLVEGQQLTIDTEQWSLSSPDFTPDYAALVHAGIGHWFTMEPVEGGPVVTYSQTGAGPGTVTISARRTYLGG